MREVEREGGWGGGRKEVERGAWKKERWKQERG